MYVYVCEYVFVYLDGIYIALASVCFAIIGINDQQQQQRDKKKRREVEKKHYQNINTSDNTLAIEERDILYRNTNCICDKLKKKS